MADGRAFHIPHPDFLLITPAGRTVVAVDQNGVVHILDLLLKTEIETDTAPAASS